jgi:restriction system protein
MAFNLSLTFIVVLIGLPIWICIWFLSDQSAIAASVGSSLVITILNALWENNKNKLASRKADLARATYHESILALADAIIREHAAELTIRRKQLTVTLSYGVVDDSKWQQDVEFFIDELIENSGGDVRSSAVRLQSVRKMINTATAQFDVLRMSFSPDMDPIAYEQMVADSLTDLGWKTRLTKTSGDQGIDVIAEMRGKRVVIQCKRYASSIGNSAVQEAYAGKSFENADYAAVVSNAEFTRSARQIADATQVILLHHDALSQLALRIFGTAAYSGRS